MNNALKETLKIPVNETNLDSEAHASQHQVELTVQVDSLKKENK